MSIPAASSPSRLFWGGFFAVTGSLCFSAKAIVVKLAYHHGVDAVTLVMYRMLFALPVFAGMAWWAGRGKPALTRADAWGVVGLGVSGYYLASFLDFWGLQFITVSLERLILYLNPTLVLLLGGWLYQRRARPGQLWGMVLSYAGVLLVFGHELSLEGPHVGWGAVLVFASAMSYALYLVYSGELVRRLGALRLAGWATSVACVCCIAQFVLLRPLAAVQVAPAVWGWSLLNALLCTALPVVLVMLAVERLGSGLTAQLGMLGLISTIGMGIVVLGEPFNAWMASGTLCVALGVFWATKAGVK